MHKLDRDPAPPAGLGRYKHGRDRWSKELPNARERGEIWAKLNAMQGARCAYCEAALVAGHCHIEHFRQRDRYPQGTFLWDNLFGSCNRPDTCGKFKDNCGSYHPHDLIKPDVEDPDAFLVFDANGGVAPRDGLAEPQLRRARETIRIFGLDSVLNQIRRAELEGYKQTAEDFMAFSNAYPLEEWMPLFQEELDKIAELPFATAIRHMLTPSNVNL